MIHFQLREVNRIEPWGEGSERLLHWFGLTDGTLWLKFGNQTVYEYTKEALEHLGNSTTPYNDYQIARFIEDFTGLFDKISETIPEKLYESIKNLEKYHSDAKKWLGIYDTDEDNHSTFYFEEYDRFISWVYQRTLDAMHLIGGPSIAFFRRDNRLRIVWYTEHVLENGISLWSAKNGFYEMDYHDFVAEVRVFGHSFFEEMGKQVEKAVARDWGEVMIDKQGLLDEHQQRKSKFYTSLLLLEQEPTNLTDWSEINQLFKRMIKETNA